MSDIAHLEARLSAALERIARGLEQVSLEGATVQPGEGEAEALRAALEDEKLANAQLHERVRLIRERQDVTVNKLERSVLRLQERVAAQDAEIARLKRVNAQLRENAAALREAVVAGTADAAAIDAAMQAELEATRAAQAADRAELDTILADLKPLIEETADV